MDNRFWEQSPQDRWTEVITDIAYEMEDRNPGTLSDDYEAELYDMLFDEDRSKAEELVEMYNELFDENLTVKDIETRHPERDRNGHTLEQDLTLLITMERYEIITEMFKNGCSVDEVTAAMTEGRI